MLHVPTPVVAGDSILLKCEYELGNETLYAVKWYKNMGEFYRYVPASDPPLKTFPQAGIDVDNDLSKLTSPREAELGISSRARTHQCAPISDIITVIVLDKDFEPILGVL
ncbi:uncharacterized protein TNIN_186631 [Trichonephila inaurata madagascariensis]|uniref:Ig-like domain-containing protein n=1 Tax=Trichonephila inaurata madagascariensis TaxID=2747483 RepID=A0A8X6J6J6_9ARAC|nr:uncharacterized protein TNIN_186631 [Trichonephila inaurata madagascariensis]